MRGFGYDSFDDFEVVMLVHEAHYDQQGEKSKSSVRFIAGSHVVQTDANANGTFQQPLTLFVEQGTSVIKCELLDGRDKVLAHLKFFPEADVLHKAKNFSLPSEQVFSMKQKEKKVTNPKLRLSMAVDSDLNDAETGLLSGMSMSSDTRYMVKQQLHKVLAEGGDATTTSEVDMLAHACCGPLDMFAGLGEAKTVHVGVVGPPYQRKYTFSIWESKLSMEKRDRAKSECDLMRVRSVQADPSRANVFIINYVDTDRVTKQFSFRRIDRSRDVWVEMLQLLIKNVHESAPARRVRHGK